MRSLQARETRSRLPAAPARQVPIAPTRDDSLEPHDELLFITTPEFEDELEAMLSPGERMPRVAE